MRSKKRPHTQFVEIHVMLSQPAKMAEPVLRAIFDRYRLWNGPQERDCAYVFLNRKETARYVDEMLC